MLRRLSEDCARVLALAAVGAAAALSAAPAPAEAWTQAERDTGYVVFEHNPLAPMPPDTVPARENITDTLSCALARDDTGSIQFGVHALADELTNIRVTVAAAVPVTVHHRIEPAVMQQLVQDGELSSWYAPEWYLQKGDAVASLASGRSVNFLLTFRAAPDTAPGPHEGRVRIETDGRPATELDLTIRVRRLVLAAPRIAFGMWYEPSRLPKRLGSWGIADETALKVFRDQAAHGQNSVSLVQVGDFSQLPPRSRLVKDVELARRAGLLHADIPCHMESGNIEANDTHDRALSMPQIRAAAAWLQRQHREHGWPEMKGYGWDEPPYPAPGMGAPGIRPRYVPLRDVPIRITTAMDSKGAYGHGDLFDVWMVMGGEITPAMRAEAARLGAEAWTYSFRIWREDFRPLRQRYYAGLYTWAHRLGGNYVWAYAHGHHSHAWFEPGSDEPMPTTGWEARRDGVNDYRYLQMLEDLTTAQPEHAAAAWLAALRERLLPVDPHLAEPGTPLALAEYESIRETVSRFIAQLGPLSSAQSAPQPMLRLKDEAARFRGESVAACIAGLKGADSAQRRAAVRALAEMGPEASEAVPDLAELLADPEVRFPALHALEAVGWEAGSATTAVGVLLADPDHFVRLGATFALAGMACAPSWDPVVMGYDPRQVATHADRLVPLLLRALQDPESPNSKITMAAALGLFRCGQAAAAALPAAIALLDRVETFTRVAQREADSGTEAAYRILTGLGPAAAPALPRLLEEYEKVRGSSILITAAIAAMGPAAAAAIPVLEKYRIPDNSYLATTCYALFRIRGAEADLKMIAEILMDKERPYADRREAARYLIALGGTSAPVADFVRRNLSKLEPVHRLDYRIRKSFFAQVEKDAPPLRLLPR